jgi:competence protein ComEC
MTIVAGLFLLLFGPRLGAAAAMLGIAVYTLLVGVAPAVVRAAIMAGVALLARQVGRRQHGLNSLALVAALMALFHPSVLWDIGFQLSFAATLGLVLYAEPLSQAFQRLIASRWSPIANHLSPSACKMRLPMRFFRWVFMARSTLTPRIWLK